MSTIQVEITKCVWCNRILPDNWSKRICENCEKGSNKELTKLIGTLITRTRETSNKE